MALEPKDNKRKNNLLDFRGRFTKAKLSDSKKSGVLPFLNEAAPLINRQLPDYTGSVTLHIRDGELTDWEYKTGGHY